MGKCCKKIGRVKTRDDKRYGNNKKQKEIDWTIVTSRDYKEWIILILTIMLIIRKDKQII